MTHLGQRLDTRQHEYLRLKEYWEGDQPLAFISEAVRKELGRRVDSVVINWPGLIVNSIAERMTPQGFMVPENDALTDQINFIWQANNMDEQSQQAIQEKILYGRSYALVWGNERDEAQITIESARSMIAYRDPATRVWTVAIKRWAQEDGYAYGVVYTSDSITLVKSKQRDADTSDFYSSVDQVTDFSHVASNGWVVIDRVDNPLGELPVVVIPNRPRLLEPEGISELHDVLPLADAINKMATDMMVTSEFFAAPRRWATGVELEEDANGDLKDELEKQKGYLRWHLFESPEAAVGQFEEATLENFAMGLDTLTKYLAGVKKIPAHYLDPAKSGLASAEAVRAAEAPLVVLAKREMVPTGGALETMARLALMVESGDLPSNAELKMETQWADPENLTASQRVDAASKKAALQVPVIQLWRDAGYTENEIEEMKQMRAEEQAAAAATQKEEDDSTSSRGKPGPGAGKPGGRG